MTVIYSFAEFEEKLRALLAEEKYLEIINLIEDEGERYPNQHIYLVYWQIGMAAREKNPELALHYLDQLVEEGIWISQYLLRTSPSFEPLQDLISFEERVSAMAALQRREASQLLPLLTLRQDTGGETNNNAYPLLIGLHADRATALESIKYWQPVAEQGWLVGIPQSSQAMWSGAYVWDDISQAQIELSDHVAGLAQKYKLDHKRILLSGHAQGGELAAWLPCSGGLNVRGFIAVSPTGAKIENPDRWFHMLQASNPSGIRGVIIVGDREYPYIPELKRLTDILNAFDVPTKLDILPGVSDNFDPAYESAVLRAIDYILT